MESERIMKHINELESLVLESTKNSNKILQIEKLLFNSDNDEPIRLAALHALRRIFSKLFDSGSFSKPKSKSSAMIEKVDQYRSWLMQRYSSFKSELYKLASHEALDIQAPVIRTLAEFVRYENSTSELRNTFGGMSSFSKLIVSLMACDEIDIDILLMMQEEIFNQLDCAYHALVTVRRVLEQEKIRLREADSDELTGGSSSDAHQVTSVLVQNALDILRVLEAPPTQEEIDDENSEFLCAKLAEDEGSEVPSSEDESDDDSDREEVMSSKTKKRSLQQISHAVGSAAGSKSKKKRSKLSLAAQVFVAECHAREFSKAWIILLSFPMSQKTLKLVLKHLPDNVIPYLQSPLLLADYLTTTVKRGGLVAVLAIESLFQMIIQYNLDYPNFFSALYQLCTPEVFAARYRNKFMRLLHRSLKSTNIPAYVAAAFIKKLVNLCLHIPGPPVMFCLTQAIWLLQHHPACLTLIHKEGPTAVPGTDPFDASLPLEECRALSSQLFEVYALQHHYIREVAQLATALQNDPLVTSSKSAVSSLLEVEQYIEWNYVDMMRENMKKNKGHCALNLTSPPHVSEGKNEGEGVFCRGAIASCLMSGGN